MKAMTLLLLTLLLVATLSQATRPIPKEPNSVKCGCGSSAVQVQTYGPGYGGPSGRVCRPSDQESEVQGVAAVPEINKAEEEVYYCEGVSEEECLMMRRTLVAHTDYIYTQRDHHKP